MHLMAITESALHDALSAAFPNGEIALKDLAGDNDHWSATITCTTFTGKTRLEQHRMVQKAVAQYDIHALQITTRTP